MGKSSKINNKFMSTYWKITSFNAWQHLVIKFDKELFLKCTANTFLRHSRYNFSVTYLSVLELRNKNSKHLTSSLLFGIKCFGIWHTREMHLLFIFASLTASSALAEMRQKKVNLFFEDNISSFREASDLENGQKCIYCFFH